MSALHPVRRAWRCPSRLPPLVDLSQEHRDAQPFARGLARQELALSFRQMSPLPVVLGMGVREKYGKHTVFLGASFLAHTHAQHDGERGHLPERQRQLLPGETTRKRLGIPMFLGEVR